MTLRQKNESLRARLSELDGLAIAFSGGVDSTLLLAVAHDVLGDRVLAVTAKSRLFPERECREAIDFCTSRGIRQVVLEFAELEVPGLAENPEDRCYLCKSALFQRVWNVAREHGIEHLAEGSNVDDLNDYRPGARAVVEQGAISPLRDAGLAKSEIRELSRARGLSTSEKPSFACLASRFPHGELITHEKLSRIEQAEDFLFSLGFTQVRVRYHGDVARIETDEDGYAQLTDRAVRERVCDRFSELGFKYTALDLLGYRTGSMNPSL